MAFSIDRALVWFRRDLRADDNAALHQALLAAREVWCVFVFDRDILDPLPVRDRRVEFIHDSLTELDRDLADLGARHGRPGVRLIAVHDRAVIAIPALARALRVQAVFANHDDEPASLARDASVQESLGAADIALRTWKDHVVFERSEVLTAAGTPFTVFTPYKNAWLRKLEPFHLEAYPVASHASGLAPLDGRGSPAPGSCSRTSSTGSTTTTRPATSRPSRVRATCPCTCGSARCPSASWRGSAGSAQGAAPRPRGRRARAGRSGCPS